MHDLVSTYFGGHFMPESTALQKVRRNSRLRPIQRAALHWQAAIRGDLNRNKRRC